MIPHDAHGGSGPAARWHPRTAVCQRRPRRSALPDVIPVPAGFRRDDAWEYDLIEDTSQRPEPYNQQVAATGIPFGAARADPSRRAVCRGACVHVAHAPGVYQPGDVLAARRIAQRFALCLSGERGVEASQARGRSGRPRLAARVARAGAVRRARRAHGLPARDRRIGVMARGAHADDAGGGHRHDRAAAGRVGDRQGGRRAIPAPRVGAQPVVPSSRSTARPCRSSCWRRSCSATNAARSPARRRASPGSWNRPPAGRCFSTKSARWRRRRRPSSCGCRDQRRRRHVGRDPGPAGDDVR